MAAITNLYDNLCNHSDPQKSLNSYQALSHLYKEAKDYLDNKLLVQFIRCLGIYPPGTVVQLNNQALGLVILFNTTNPLKPSLLIYDQDIPKEGALILDLEDDPELAIRNSIHPGQLPKDAFTYLNPRVRVTYYLEDRSAQPGH